MASAGKKIAAVRTALKSRGSTIKECSRSKPDDAENTSTDQTLKYVVEREPLASMPTSDFDAVQKEWYKRFAGGHMPCSVDTLFIDRDGVFYAIEFKSGGINSANLIRKIHETIMGCMENLATEGQQFAQHEFYRLHMVYLVVASELESPASSSKTCYRTFQKYHRPWDVPGFPVHWKLKPLEDIVVKRVFTLSPTMFFRFAKVNKWI